ncbi:MAG: SRPBCC family protein [Candidatus Competibacteraceae bacterium]
MTKAFRWRRFIFFLFGATVALTAMTAIFLQQAYRQPMELYEQRVISGQIKEVWRVATDVNRWPEWDPHEEAGEIFGAFVEGTRGFSKPRGGPGAHWTLTEVTENRSWSLINPMRIGTLRVDNRYTQLSDGKVLCEKHMQVSGWVLIALFKLHFEAATRKDMQATWVALESRLARATL